MNIILLGAPGSGKGTQAALLVEKHRFTHINPGILFREAVAADNELGKQVAGALERGELVSDELATQAVYAKIGTRETGFLFDGYPRTMGQVMDLNALHLNNFDVDLIVYLEAPLDVLKERLLNRHRADDLTHVIEERFRWFEEYTLPVVEFYQHDKRFVKLDATLPVAVVAEQIQLAIKSKLKQ